MTFSWILPESCSATMALRREALLFLESVDMMSHVRPGRCSLAAKCPS